MSDTQRTYEPRMWFFAAMIGYALLARLWPYAGTDPTSNAWIWNFSPLYAICLFGAAFYRDRRWAFAVPLATYFVGDLGIWAITGRLDWAFYANQPIVYAAVALFVVVGLLLRKHRSWAAVFGCGMLGAVLFYLVTNFGVWATGDGTLYPHTAEGLFTCYVRAIPYFRSTIISTLLFSGILFSPLGVRALEAAEREPQRDLQPARRVSQKMLRSV